VLLTLHIENIAAIEKVDIDFRGGLNVLTGETGAGKSIVIDSLEAALGWRTSRDLVRTGAESALVTAVFSTEGAEDWCRENEVELDGGELVLTRRIGADGRTSCRVNGVPMSAAQTRSLGLLLIDIHGQGEGQKLLNERYHLSYLDGFAGLGAEAAAYGEAYERYVAVRKELEKLRSDAGERERRIDMLRFQIGELERAELSPGEYAEITKRRDFLKNAGKLTEAVNEAFYAMFGGERASGAIDCIASAEAVLAREAKLSESVGELAAKLTELRYAAEEAAEDIRAARDDLDFSPQELEEIETRVDTLRRVLKKYGGTEEAALDYLDKSRTELDEVENAEVVTERLERELDARRREAEDAAAALSAKRRAAAETLSRRIETELHDLSMGGAVFVTEVREAADLGPTGRDDVRFILSANLGEEPGPISRVASGGELSRIMLAMKAVLAANDTVPVMVFDEIDTGVSGIAAQRVAEKLALIAGEKQVVCVTHLPQIAVMADTQFSVVKEQKEGRTFTSVHELDAAGRRQEVARLTGGQAVTATTLASAAELLDAAEAYKKTTRE